MYVRCDLLLLLATSIATKADYPLVKVKQGKISGTSSSDGSYDIFEGISYAVPPLGDRRFKSPVPAPHWKGIFYANRTNIQCPQFDSVTSQVVGTEDCLVLNLYRPRNCHHNEKRQSVMVFIHGGAFTTGSGGIYGAEFLVNHGVIIVTINYRLTSLGFLCFRTEDIPGNAGLKDQRLALRWVKDNINAFGGDANSIIIFGNAVGAASVELHTLTEPSAGIFQKAITQSGSALAEWVLDRDPFRRVYEIARNLGADTCHDLAYFFQNVDFDKLIRASVEYDTRYPSLPVYVCVEDWIENTEPFITDYPANLIESNSGPTVPFMTGFNNGEGMYDVYKIVDGFNRLNQNFFQFLPRDLCFESQETEARVTKIVRQFYFGDKEITNDTIEQYVNYFTDMQVLSSMVFSLKARIKTSDMPQYVYEFRYEGQRNLKTLLDWAGPGAAHFDELPYLFNIQGYDFPTPISLADQLIIERMTTMWTNFAKYKDPTPHLSSLLRVKWVPASSTSLDTFIINLDLSIEKRPLQERSRILGHHLQ